MSKPHYSIPRDTNLHIIDNLKGENNMNNSAVKKIDFNPENDTITAFVVGARQTNHVAVLPLHLLTVPRYQRDERNKIGYLTKNWSENDYDPIKVSYRDGKFFIVDGLQRTIAAERIGLTNLPCKVLENLTEQDEVRIYKAQNKGRAPMIAYDNLKADASIGNDPGASVMRICAECGVVLSKTGRAPAGQCGCAAVVKKAYETVGENGLKWMFQLVDDLGWRPLRNGYRANIMRAFMVLYGNKKNHEAVKTAIMKRCEKKTPDEVDLEARQTYKFHQNPVIGMLNADCKGIK